MEECRRSRIMPLLRDVRAVMTPVWTSIHDSDVIWYRAASLPATPSHAMCRHATAFLKRIMLDADRRAGIGPRSPEALSSRYRAVEGGVDVDRLPVVPEYLHRSPRHFAVMDDAGDVIDVTADQFGLDPLSIRPWSTFFAERPLPCDPGLAASARAWVMHPEYPVILAAASVLTD